MNTFSNMELSDLLSGRFRLEEKHNPQYLAECLQRLFPTLGRMSLSGIAEEMARANSRCFNTSRLPVRGETLNLSFFFDLWKRNFRFEGGIYDKFVFTDELKLAFKLNPREFWEVLIRADREIGSYLKDSFELMQYRELPREMSFMLKAGRGMLEYQYADKIKQFLPPLRANSSLVKLEGIAKACISIFGMPKFYDERRVVEELCRENNIRRMDREPCIAFPIRNIANLSVAFLKRAMEERLREEKRMTEDEALRKRAETARNEHLDSLSSVGTLTKAEIMFRGEEVKPYPENINGNLYLPIIALTTSAKGKEFIRIEEEGPGNEYKWKKVYDTAKPHQGDYDYSDKTKDWTIGIGHKIQPKEWDTYLPKGKSISLSNEEMDALFEKDLKRIEAGVKNALKDARLSQYQFDALIAFSYQNGENRIGRDEHNTPKLREYIHVGDTVKATEFIRNFRKGHENRRGREADMYEKGMYRNKG